MYVRLIFNVGLFAEVSKKISISSWTQMGGEYEQICNLQVTRISAMLIIENSCVCVRALLSMQTHNIISEVSDCAARALPFIRICMRPFVSTKVNEILAHG